MSRENKIKKWIIGGLLIAAGFIFGGTWGNGMCLGDRMFAFLGLQAWSDGTAGTHYPAIIGFLIIMAGCTFINMTMKEKTRIFFWPVAFILFFMLSAAI